MGAIAQPPAQERIRVLIVDDHPTTREGLIAHLSQNGYQICGEADDIPSALQLIASTQPDVAVVDVSLKRGSGIELVQRVRVRNPSVRMLVWSMYEDSLYAGRALRAGAAGYINKAEATHTIADAIRHIHAGGIHLSPAMTEVLVRQATSTSPAVPEEPLSQLSDRELEVFRLLGQCLDTAEIAARMNLSPKTVETYRSRMRQKLGVANSAELLRLAVRWALPNG